MNRSSLPNSKRILVDDTDARLVYRGPWEVLQQPQQASSGSFGAPLQQTLHGVRPHASAEFVFEYEGSSVEVWGSIPVDRSFDADWECLVDGQPADRVVVSTITRSRHRQKLCEWRSNDFGKHLLYVNATSRENGQFLFDYVAYAPSPTAGPLTGLIQIPHDDPDFAFQGPRWRIEEGSGRRTRLPNNGATLEFFGTSLEWYGFETSEFPSKQSLGTYSIDGTLPSEFVYSGIKNEGGEPNFNQVLFKTPELNRGPHTLIVTHQGPDAPLTLSYVIVENISDEPAVNGMSVPTASVMPTAPEGIQATPPAVNPGTVAGAVIGSLGGLALIGILVFFFIRWRRKTQLPMIQPLPGFVKPEAAAPLDIDIVNTRRSDELFPPSRPGSYAFQPHTRRRSNARRFNPEVRSTISSVHLNPPPVQNAPPSTTNTGFDNDSINEVSRPTPAPATQVESDPYSAGYPYATMQLSDYQKLVGTKKEGRKSKSKSKDRSKSTVPTTPQVELDPYASGYPYAAMQLSDYQKLVEATKEQEHKVQGGKVRDSYM